MSRDTTAPRRILIVGGGAAGFFAAITAAENAKKHNIFAQVTILEASENLLKKVRISGGGRCNVTHHCFEVKKFVGHYPRGSKELIGPMQRFQASDTVEWFKRRGVEIVAEDDGRMFPSSNKSETIINCFMKAAADAGVVIRIGCIVQGVRAVEGGGFSVRVKAVVDGGEGEVRDLPADAVMIATGSSPIGYRLARELGHTITELAPSLFSFKITDPLLSELPGLSFEARVKLTLPAEVDTAKMGKAKKAAIFEEQGPLLITHWGLSGPAVLKISAWSAREMMRSDYKGVLRVNWLSLSSVEKAHEMLRQLRDSDQRAQVMNAGPSGLAKRFWAKFLEVNGVSGEKRWAEVSRVELSRLGERLFATDFKVEGKNRYKDEFVECGGVSLKEIDFKTMSSKIHSDLYFAGEVLDIDGITGGFNFQNAWTGGYIAGHAMMPAES